MSTSILANIIELTSKGDRLFVDIESRCQATGKTIGELCREARVSVATLWRIRQAVPATLEPLRRLEKQLRKWEKANPAGQPQNQNTN